MERLFGALKSVDFESIDTPDILKTSLPSAKKFTHTQIIISKITKYLFEIEPRKIARHYSESFKNLDQYLRC